MGNRMPPSSGSRHRARVFVLLGLYQWLANPTKDYAGIEAHLNELIQDDGAPLDECDIDPKDFKNCDKALFEELLSGVLDKHVEIEAMITPFIDRDLSRVSLVERAILYLGTYEFMYCPQTPWRVVINESIELAKRFGSGYRFTNAILDQVAHKVRQTEVEADAK